MVLQDRRPPSALGIPVLYRAPQLGGELAGCVLLPASSGQRRLWFLAQLDPASAAAYRIDTAARLTGPLDLGALRRAVGTVVERHESLRTALREADGEPVQVVTPSVPVPLEQVDLVGETDPDAAVRQLLGTRAGRPFDLAAAPLVRVVLACLGPDDHLLLVCLHHVVGDRWSVHVLLRELVTGYEAYARGEQPELPPLPVQYADWAGAQLSWLAGPQAAASSRHWREQLVGAPVLELPTDRPRSTSRGYRGALRWYDVPAGLLERVEALAARHHATPFVVTMAAFATLLARWTGQPDVVVGTPVAGRDRPETEPVIGFLVNTVVLRTDVAGDPTGTELVDRVREAWLDAYAHADLPFERLVADLRPTRHAARNPFFDVVFAVQNTPVTNREMAGVRVRPVDVDAGTSQFDLSVMVVPTPVGTRLRVEYDSALLDESTVDRMAAAYLAVLDELVDRPDRPVSALAPGHGAGPGVVAGPAAEAVSAERAVPPAAPVPPRTAREAELAAIWAEVLRRDEVGVLDDFFDLGGHSLRAVRAVARMRAAYGLELDVRVLFDRPTVAGLAELVDELLAGAGADGAAPAGVAVLARRPEPDGTVVLPASSGQRRLSFLAELDPAGAGAYVMGSRVRLTGPLDAELLRRAVGTVVARHEPLRTALSMVDGEPVQVVHTAVPDPVRFVELPPGPGTADELTRAELTRPFDLAAAPLLRVTVTRTGPAEHLLLFALHHSVGDQASVQVLVHEVATCYTAYAAGAEPDLPAPRLHFADWVAAQEAWLGDAEAARQEEGWRERLAGLPALDLATDRPRPAVRRSRGGLVRRDLPASPVRALARRQDVTVFMAGMAAFQLLLARWSGQRDFGVATAVSGRDRPELERLIGFFANTLVVRADLTGRPTGTELLARVRESCLAAYAGAALPFERLTAALADPGDLSRTPLAQAAFAVTEELSAADRRMGAVQISRDPFDPGTAKTDLTLTLTPVGDRLHAEFEYDSDLFDKATARRLADHYGLLLGELAAEEDRPVGMLPALPPGDDARLAEWGAGPVRPLPEGTVADLFLAQAARTPDAVAVAGSRAELTYAELAARAAALAGRLRDAGVRPGTRVALFAERSAEAVAGVLGILLSGGTYVPVDPAYPAERVGFLLADSAAPVVVAGAELAGRVPAPATVVPLDADHGPGGVQCCPAGPDDVAYVIYTSGSTGTPKGVEILHRSVVNLHLTRDLTGLPPGSRVLQMASLSFDVSVWELVMALLGGHTLVVPDPDDLTDPARIVVAIRERRVTASFLPPSLLAHLTPDDVPTLRTVCSGGEDCPADVAARWSARTRLVIGYGPTETTVLATATGAIAGGGHPPIGRPVCNTLLRVLDPDGRPVPIGVPGELHIGGAGLARGYLGRPELTAERFVLDSAGPGRPGPDPAGPGRLYRTGDLVRYRPDGDLEFLGRLDDQVKLRGFRIELGEVEAALRARPGVRDAVAAVREDVPGDQRLVGYVVPVEAPADAAAFGHAVRDGLRAVLPHHLVPAAVAVLDTVPLTPNGKVDRHALPAPPGAAGAYRPPATATEHRLAGILATALGVERVGLDDSFFDLGGHSLLAARAHATIKVTFAVELPVRTLFEHPRLGELAASIDAAGSADGSQEAHRARLRADVTLPPEIRPGRPTWTAEPADILLTGATGFLGSALLDRLLTDTGATVHCLVRGTDDEDARHRLRAALTDLGHWRPERAGRIRAVAGDLAAPALGLTDRRFAALAERVQEIHHVGAAVNFLLPYEQVRAANVAGLREILRLAAGDRSIPVHHVSTMSVFAGLGPGTPVLFEDGLPDVPPPATDTGYNASKWVAEQIVVLARERGLPVTVHRPGRIGGDTRTGAWRTDDLVRQTVRACAAAGAVPDAGLATDLVPVDHLAAVISRLARTPESLGRTFHVALDRKVPLLALADAFAALGRPMQRLALPDWHARVRSAADRDVALGLVVAMYAPFADGRASAVEPTFDCSATAELLGDTLPQPSVDVPLLSRYLGWMDRAGLLPG